MQAALPDLEDLRVACETLYILQLRGVVIKWSARTSTEQARSLVMYRKIPKLLLPKFPMYVAMLEPFSSLLNFHKARLQTLKIRRPCWR